jgi:hypothetical protein
VHLCLHVLLGAKGQYLLNIYTAVKGEAITKISLQFCRIHSSGSRLYRIKHLNAGLDEIGDEWADTATTVNFRDPYLFAEKSPRCQTEVSLPWIFVAILRSADRDSPT